MKKTEKERVVAELAERLKSSPTLIVADYRGLTMPQIDDLRGKLLEHGARFSVVKNTLTRRAAEEAGVDALLGMLEGPTAIAFLESDGDAVAVAKALSTVARTAPVLEIRGGVMEGKVISGADVESLAKLPPIDMLHAQLVGALAGPMTTVVGIFNAPLRDLVGVLQARIDQLGGEAEPSEPEAPPEPEVTAEPEAAEPKAAEPESLSGSEPLSPESEAEAAPEAEATPEPEPESVSGSEPQSPESETEEQGGES